MPQYVRLSPITPKLQHSLAQTDSAKSASFRMDLKYYTKISNLYVSRTRVVHHSGSILMDDLEDLDYVLVPIGGGGLIAGISIAINWDKQIVLWIT